jgi:paraquat-inducible protein A
MVEVFLLATLVSLARLQRMAGITFGAGFWSFAALVVCLAAAVTIIDYRELWERLEHAKQ